MHCYDLVTVMLLLQQSILKLRKISHCLDAIIIFRLLRFPLSCVIHINRFKCLFYFHFPKCFTLFFNEVLN